MSCNTNPNSNMTFIALNPYQKIESKAQQPRNKAKKIHSPETQKGDRTLLHPHYKKHIIPLYVPNLCKTLGKMAPKLSKEVLIVLSSLFLAMEIKEFHSIHGGMWYYTKCLQMSCSTGCSVSRAYVSSFN